MEISVKIDDNAETYSGNFTSEGKRLEDGLKVNMLFLVQEYRQRI